MFFGSRACLSLRRMQCNTHAHNVFCHVMRPVTRPKIAKLVISAARIGQERHIAYAERARSSSVAVPENCPSPLLQRELNGERICALLSARFVMCAARRVLGPTQQQRAGGEIMAVL